MRIWFITDKTSTYLASILILSEWKLEGIVAYIEIPNDRYIQKLSSLDVLMIDYILDFVLKYLKIEVDERN